MKDECLAPSDICFVYNEGGNGYSRTPQSADFGTEQNCTADCEIRRLRNPQIASVIVCSKWDRMVYNTVLTAEKRGWLLVGVYCTLNLEF